MSNSSLKIKGEALRSARRGEPASLAGVSVSTGVAGLGQGTARTQTQRRATHTVRPWAECSHPRHLSNLTAVPEEASGDEGAESAPERQTCHSRVPFFWRIRSCIVGGGGEEQHTSQVLFSLTGTRRRSDFACGLRLPRAWRMNSAPSLSLFRPDEAPSEVR